MIEGSGSPEGVVPAQPGRMYRDADTNDLYMKMGGVQENGWRKVGTAPQSLITGGREVFHSDVDPNGVVEATGPAICLGKDALAGALWAKTTSGTSKNDWVLIISP